MPTHNREWQMFVEDMIEFCEKAISYTDGIEMDAFLKDEIRYEATLWNIRLIGEAATRVPAETQHATPSIEWAEIIGMRNQLTHGYFRTRHQIVWDTIKTDIPKLLSDLRKLLKQFDKGKT